MADLEAGKIYFIEAVPQMGDLKAQVQLVPIAPTDSKRIEKIKKLMAKKPSESFTSEELDPENENLKEDIAKGIEKYKENLAAGKKVERLTKEVAHSN